jgi:predicted nucleic acid-binding protein
MHIVFVASITMTWCFDDESTPQTDAMLDQLGRGHAAVVPQIWALEVANVLAIAMRKKRISGTDRTRFLKLLDSLPILADVRPAHSVFSDVLPLADRYKLSVYDASYLELAVRMHVPMATLDRELRTAAASAGVTLISALPI